MGDVKEILGLGSPSPAKVVKPAGGPPPSGEKKKKRPTGLSREVLQLREGQQHLVPLMPTITSSVHSKGFKEKRKLGSRKADRWVWKPFRNSARSEADVMALSHWVKEKDRSIDYSFTKFNKKAKIFKYTSEQYEQHLKSTDWTKEETDVLFEMCERFELRFLVIADRWPQTMRPRDVESIKERYYQVYRQLAVLNQVPGEDLAQNPAIKYPYQAAKDRERKTQFEHFYNRTKEQVQEEETLMLEWARLDRASKKHAADSAKLLKIVTKRRTKEMQLQAALEKSGGSVVATFARSGKLFSQPVIPPHKQQKYQPYVQAVLQELGVVDSQGSASGPGGARLSGQAAMQMSELRNDIILMFEMQRLQLEMEYQLAMLKEHQQLLNKADNAAAIFSAAANNASSKLSSSSSSVGASVLSSAALSSSSGAIIGAPLRGSGEDIAFGAADETDEFGMRMQMSPNPTPPPRGGRGEFFAGDEMDDENIDDDDDGMDVDE